MDCECATILVREHVRVRDDEWAIVRALVDGGRIFSSYLLDNGRKIWVITEAEDEGKRASTCLLEPDEY